MALNIKQIDEFLNMYRDGLEKAPWNHDEIYRSIDNLLDERIELMKVSKKKRSYRKKELSINV